MPVTDTLILLLFLMVVLASCIAYMIAKIGAIRKWESDKVIRIHSLGLYVSYTATLLVLTFIAREKRTDGLIYLIPFENFAMIIKNGYPWYYDNIVRNTVINAVLFVPLGVLGAEILRKKIALAVIGGFTISLVIELMQLVTQLGVFDVDDLLFNTLGTLLGIGLFALCRLIYRRIAKKKS